MLAKFHKNTMSETSDCQIPVEEEEEDEDDEMTRAEPIGIILALMH